MFKLFQPARMTSRYWISMLLLAILITLGLSACDAKRYFGDENEMANAIQQNVYNYTRYDFIQIIYQDASQSPDIARATAGGATYAYDSNIKELGSGVFFHAAEMLCCIRWNPVENADVVLRVKWLAVHDRAVYQAALRISDDRATRGSLPGSQWCEALVKVAKPYPDNPDIFALHFLPDGSLQAYVRRYGETGPLPIENVLKHTPASGPVLCKARTSNPFYGIPHPPHRE